MIWMKQFDCEVQEQRQNAERFGTHHRYQENDRKYLEPVPYRKSSGIFISLQRTNMAAPFNRTWAVKYQFLLQRRHLKRIIQGCNIVLKNSFDIGKANYHTSIDIGKRYILFLFYFVVCIVENLKLRHSRQSMAEAFYGTGRLPSKMSKPSKMIFLFGLPQSKTQVKSVIL